MTSRGAGVSVCIPTFNGEAHIEEALESAQSQDWRPLEIVVVDDGSNDGTVGLVERRRLRDERIRLVRRPHHVGLVSNWNHCARLIRFRWLKFLFQDDVLAPGCITGMVRSAPDHNAPAIVVCQRWFSYETADLARGLDYAAATVDALDDSDDGDYVTPCDCITRALRSVGRNFLGEPSAVLLSAATLDRFGLFDARFISLCDFEYWMRVASNVGVHRAPTAGVLIRIHDAATSTLNMTRLYERDVLDPARLLCEFATRPYYEQLRRVAERIAPERPLPLLARTALETAKTRAGDAADLLRWRRLADEYSPMSSSLKEG